MLKIQSAPALKQRFSALENRQASTEADITQVNTYIGSVGQLIRRYIEIESKFDQVLEYNGEMQAMKYKIQLIKQSVDGIIKKQDLQHERLRLCQPELRENIEEVTQAVREVQSNVAQLSETLQLKQGVEKMKNDIKPLTEDLKVQLNNGSILRAEDNITLTEMFAEGYSQLTENMNELEFNCQQNYSALQQIHASEFSNLQSNISRLDHDLSTQLSYTETMNNRVSPATNTGNAGSGIAFYNQLSGDIRNPGKFRTIVFDSIITNEGDAYNSYRGRFTCPEDGLYGFTWAISVPDHPGGVTAQLVLNGNVIGRVKSNGGNHDDVYDVAGSTAILKWSIGDVVSLRTGRHANYIVSNADLWSTFAG